MIEFMKETEKNRVGIRVDGDVGEGDFRAMATLIREQIEAHGKIRLVLRVESIGLVTPAVLWEEFKLAFDHFDDVERVALVGDDLWQEAFVKVFGPMMPAEMRHFPAEKVEDAWHWIA